MYCIELSVQWLIRETERQLSDMNPTAQITHSPVIHSGLAPAQLPTETSEHADETRETGATVE